MSAHAREGTNRVSFLRTSNVFWDRVDLLSLDEMHVPESELPGKLLMPGDLLVCEGGEIGRAAIWNGQIERVTFQNHLHRLRPKRPDVLPRFYVFFLQSAFTQLGIFEGAGIKTTIPNLSRSRLAALRVPHPDLPEQEAIADLLGQASEAIDLQTELVAAARELKLSVMSEVFKRGLHDQGAKDSPIGPVPASWSVHRLDERADVISTRMAYSELRAQSPSESSDAVTVLGIKVSDMNRSGNEIELRRAALEIDLDLGTAKKSCAPPGTIIFPKRGAAIATNKKRIAQTWTVFDPNVIGVRVRPGLDQRFLLHWFQTFDLRGITEPGPTPQLNKKNLEPLLIPVPPTATEQEEIARVLDTLDDKVEVHRHKADAASELFLSLLHKFMTGEHRVDDLRRPAA